MTDFSPKWLALRRPADERARCRECSLGFLRALPRDRSLLVDIACGSGANCTFLASLLVQPRDWLLVDNDALLLSQALKECVAISGVRRLDCRELDLAQELDRLDLSEAAGVSAAALLDLVSGPWLERLVAKCAALRLPLLLALTHNGHVRLSPSDPNDESIRLAFNKHQRRNKGFGPALGPAAPNVASALLREHGYHVTVSNSDWHLDAANIADAALLTPLLQGWAAAASELARSDIIRQRVAQWRNRRELSVTAGALRAQVGHNDLLALI